MLIFKFLHIAAMFGAVTLLFGSIVFLDLVARRGDLVAYLRLDAVVQRTDIAGIVLFVAGLVFGLIAALSGNLDLTAGWLVLAYLLVVALFIEGFVFTIPRYSRIREAANGPDEAAAAAAVGRMVRAPEHVILVTMTGLLWAAVIFVMVVKPSPF